MSAHRMAGVANRTIRTPKKRQLILNALAEGKSVAEACRRARVARSAYYDWKADDQAFADAVADAIEDGTDLLEDVLLDEAVEKRNTIAILALLKARRPQQYRENYKHEISGPDGAPIVVQFVPRPDGPE